MEVRDWGAGRGWEWLTGQLGKFLFFQTNIWEEGYQSFDVISSIKLKHMTSKL